jgi:NAD-dependent DNA ligase
MGKDVLHFIDFEGHQSVEHPYDTPGLSQKLQIEGSLVEAIDEYFKDRVNPESGEYPQFFISPKYDGSSLIIYYKNGFLDRILTKSSDDFGFDQTYKLKNFVPLEVDPSIESIQCEALVSLDSGHIWKPVL